MATLPHDTYANPTTPLWARATSGSSLVSPSLIVNNGTAPTEAVITRVGGGQGSVEYNSVPAGTAYNKITMDGIYNGVGITTNTIETFRTNPSTTTIHGTANVVDRATGGTISLDGNRILYNNAPQLNMDTTFTEVGVNSYADNTGWTTYATNNVNDYATMNDNSLTFYHTTAGSPQTLAYELNSIFVPNAPTNALIYRNPHNTNTLSTFFNATGGTLTGGSGSAPYNLTLTNTGSVPTQISFRWGGEPLGLNYDAGLMPFAWEMSTFDPGVNQYSVVDITAPAPINSLINYIRKTSGVYYMDVVGGGTITYTLGQKLRFIYNIVDPNSNIGHLYVSLDNLVVGGANFTYSISTTMTPRFQTQGLGDVPAGTSVSFTMNTYNLDSADGFLGFTWTSLGGGLYPTQFTTIAPTGTAPAGWNFAFIQGGGQTMTFPNFTGIQPGTPITLTFQTGASDTGGQYQIIINGANQGTYNLTRSWSTATYTFITTGDDLIVVKNVSSALISQSIQHIVYTWNIPVEFRIGGVGQTAVNSMAIGTGNIQSVSPRPQIELFNTPEMAINCPLYLNDVIDMGLHDIRRANAVRTSTIFTDSIQANDYTTIGVANTMSFGGTNYLYDVLQVTTNALDCPGYATDLTIGQYTSNVNISNLTNITGSNANLYNITTSNVDNPSGNITIGASVTALYLSNVYSIGNSTTLGAFTIAGCRSINSAPAVPTGTLVYTANFGGTRTLTMPLQPKRDGTANNFCFPGFSGTDFVSSVSIIVPIGATFTYTSGIVFTIYTNSFQFPAIFNFTAFNPTSTTDFYNLKYA